ncbi:MAG: L,D-transpeptidase family protein, partial [Verrucomicrobiales bacterium]
MSIRLLLPVLAALVLASSASAQLPAHCRQAIVGVAKDWNSSHVTLTLYEKNGNSWQRVGGPIPGRLGKNGLAWGLGAPPPPPP